jgi:uncharacterized membrane protein
MKEENASFPPALRISLLAIMTAVTTVMTFLVKVPSPAKGYYHLGDAAVYFTALSFGPFSALIAGGVGTALADIIGSYAQWAPFSLVIHGLQGFAVGLIAGKARDRRIPVLRWVLAFAAGTLILCAGYLAAGTLLTGFGAAVAELPGNVGQSVVGILCASLLVPPIRIALPQIRSWRW